MKNNAGLALITAIIIIVVISALGVMIGVLFSSKTAGTINHLLSVQAQFIAEGGLEEGIYQYNLAGNCSNSTTPYAGEANVALGRGTFTTTVYDTDFSGNSLPPSQTRIRSTATIGGVTRVVDQIAFCTGDSSGMIRTVANKSLTNNGTLNCGTQTCTQSQIDNGTCPCTLMKVKKKHAPSITVPTGLSGPTGDTACNPISSSTQWSSGTYYCSTLTINSGVTITLTGPVTLYVDTFTINSGDLINTSDPGGNLLVEVTSQLNFNSGASLKGYIYAPGIGVTMNGTLTGGMTADSLTINSTGVFISDGSSGSKVSGFGTNTGANPFQTSVSWQEVPPS